MSEPRRVGESLDAVLKSLRPDPSLATVGANASAPAAEPSTVGTAAHIGGVFGRWTEAVGDAVAAHVQPVKLDAGVLVVEVDDPAWSTQMAFLDETFKRRLLEVAGVSIARIEVRVKRRR